MNVVSVNRKIGVVNNVAGLGGNRDINILQSVRSQLATVNLDTLNYVDLSLLSDTINLGFVGGRHKSALALCSLREVGNLSGSVLVSKW